MKKKYVDSDILFEEAIGIQLETSAIDLMGGAIKICKRINSDCINKEHMKNCILTIKSASTGNVTAKERLRNEETFSDEHIRCSARYIGNNNFGITPQEAKIMANQIILTKKFVLR